MNMQPQNFEDLQRRVIKLEKQNRALRRLVIAVLISPILLFLMAQTPAKKTIEGNEFVLKDSSGALRATLGMHPDGNPGLDLFDKQGHKMVELQGGYEVREKTGNRPTGGSLFLFDVQGRTRVALASSTASILLLDKNGLISWGQMTDKPE